MADYSTIILERRAHAAVIKLNRPDSANGMNLTMACELAAAASECDRDASVRAVLVTGTGRFFSAGGDVKAMAAMGDGASQEVKRMADELHRAISTLQRMRAPVVVAVNGVCAGAGFSLAVSGDIVLASESSKFTMAYTSIGLSPDGSSTYFLPRLIGLRRTQELMLTNRTLSSSEALAWGLVTRTVADDQLGAEALQVLDALAAGPVQAHAAVKQLLAVTFNNGLETQMENEGRLIAACVASPEGQEGLRAFMAKQKPRFV